MKTFLTAIAAFLLTGSAFAQATATPEPAEAPRHPKGAIVVGGPLFAADKSLLPKKAHSSVFNTLGDGKFLVAGLGLLYLSGSKDSARRAGTALVNTGLATVALKSLFGRERPDESDGDTVFRPLRATDASFPSGHTSASFAVAHSLAQGRPQNVWLYGLATMVGVSRVRARRHFPTDVIAGALLGIGSAEATRRGGGSLLFVRL
ncbi:MAG: phosphatase PAP2 family protein [Armatimonas sp.]